MTAANIPQRKGPSGPRAGAVSSGGGNSLVFRPDGVAGGNVYSTWPALVAAAVSIQGPKTVTIDASLAAATIPAGAWDLGAETTIVASAGTLPTPLSLAPGATLVGVVEIVDVAVTKDGASPAILNTDAATQFFYLSGTATVTCAGAGPFLRQAVPSPFTLFVRGLAEVAAGASPVLDTLIAGTTLGVIALDAAFVDAGIIAGPAGGTYYGVVGSAAAFVDPSQPGVPGGVLTVAIWEQSRYVQYDDSLAPPLGASTVQGAIDALKALPGPPYQTDEFVAAAAQTFFVLSFLPIDIPNMEVFVNGVRYNLGSSYTVAALILTWLNSPFVMSAGDNVIVTYQR